MLYNFLNLRPYSSLKAELIGILPKSIGQLVDHEGKVPRLDHVGIILLREVSLHILYNIEANNDDREQDYVRNY